MTVPAQLPGHEQVAGFWVGALLATQAVAAYVEPDRKGGPFDPFDRLPARLKIRVLEACAQEFRRRKEALIREFREEGDRLA